MVMVVIGVVLLALRLLEIGPVAGWSWWIVLAPFGAAVIWWWWADTSGWTKKREIDRMEARKQERRRKNMESLGMDPRHRRDR